MESIKLLGFPVNPLIQPVVDDQGMINYHEQIEQKRNKLPYEIDGTVFKINFRPIFSIFMLGYFAGLI